MVYLAAPDGRYAVSASLMTLAVSATLMTLDGARYLRDELPNPTVPRVVL